MHSNSMRFLGGDDVNKRLNKEKKASRSLHKGKHKKKKGSKTSVDFGKVGLDPDADITSFEADTDEGDDEEERTEESTDSVEIIDGKQNQIATAANVELNPEQTRKSSILLLRSRKGILRRPKKHISIPQTPEKRDSNSFSGLLNRFLWRGPKNIDEDVNQSPDIRGVTFGENEIKYFTTSRESREYRKGIFGNRKRFRRKKRRRSSDTVVAENREPKPSTDEGHAVETPEPEVSRANGEEPRLDRHGSGGARRKLSRRILSSILHSRLFQRMRFSVVPKQK
ncbi:unnamed protein product [Notodromas monacha]|uniref:Uncharacterized protein n=1 Tax=Notodromas monacha TaxID=399045 RepID=A0A7R9BE72_9CRUS|nr:unnamed protein product [Notodromas monacha]CAG0913719.1 unnamed protein product [Notodromas monacha]